MENKTTLTLSVTDEQKLAIQAFFQHYDWDFNEINGENSENKDDEDVVEENTENATQESVEHQNENRSENMDDQIAENDLECEHCFCFPCVTTNRQSWVGNGQPACNRNSGVRKDKYKKFWTLMQNRGAWSHPRYLRKKTRMLNRERVDESVVIVRREVMPDCILSVVRDLYPNPKSKPYMGHRWQ